MDPWTAAISRSNVVADGSGAAALVGDGSLHPSSSALYQQQQQQVPSSGFALPTAATKASLLPAVTNGKKISREEEKEALE
jgi:hypothetical protein